MSFGPPSPSAPWSASQAPLPFTSEKGSPGSHLPFGLQRPDRQPVDLGPQGAPDGRAQRPADRADDRQHEIAGLFRRIDEHLVVHDPQLDQLAGAGRLGPYNERTAKIEAAHLVECAGAFRQARRIAGIGAHIVKHPAGGEFPGRGRRGEQNSEKREP